MGHTIRTLLQANKRTGLRLRFWLDINAFGRNVASIISLFPKVMLSLGARDKGVHRTWQFDGNNFGINWANAPAVITDVVVDAAGFARGLDEHNRAAVLDALDDGTSILVDLSFLGVVLVILTCNSVALNRSEFDIGRRILYKKSFICNDLLFDVVYVFLQSLYGGLLLEEKIFFRLVFVTIDLFVAIGLFFALGLFGLFVAIGLFVAVA
mmetsp:Transcript_17839/g.39042  ORF Transcript_17839/g.39042 Transcript_17839/m.39042 type:complete len:210 (-) Transcript_17839:208-837(-)